MREIGDDLRAHKDDLGMLVTLEMGKILAEGKGEVQEMIDIADFAVGLSRQLYGLTMHSERPEHRMYEQWHPLGVIGVISAFNFPVAVWSWNALLAAVCGDCVIWKPSLKTPLTAIAVQKICERVLDRHGWRGVFQPGHRRGRQPSGSAYSKTAAFRSSAPPDRPAWAALSPKLSARRLGRTLLELGGNNGVIVMNDANLDLALRAVLFGAVGTAGQRCTSIRRLFLQRGIAPGITESCKRLTARSESAIRWTTNADGSADRSQGRRNHARAFDTHPDRRRRDHPGRRRIGWLLREAGDGEGASRHANLQEEVFAPILYLMEFDTLEEVMAWHNNVPQGLSSAMFTTNLISAERFLSARGSDCGIANINIGTSGAEIGGAFGGEKDTGGGRESGSDAWKAYMRRQTVTINWSNELPLAQGIRLQG